MTGRTMLMLTWFAVALIAASVFRKRGTTFLTLEQAMFSISGKFERRYQVNAEKMG